MLAHDMRAANKGFQACFHLCHQLFKAGVTECLKVYYRNTPAYMDDKARWSLKQVAWKTYASNAAVLVDTISLGIAVEEGVVAISSLPLHLPLCPLC